MPATASRLLVLATDPDVDVEALASTIEVDPALTAKVLGVANSAYYAPRQPVLAVKHAIIQVLGLRMVSNLAFGIALNGAMSTRDCAAFDLTRYWVVALGTAELAGGLARAATLADRPDSDAAHLIGLLHNIGELLLVHLRPQDMGRVLAEVGQCPECDRVAVEREILGIDRWSAGALLARHWELPSLVADTIESMACDDPAAVAPPMVQLISAARHWVEGTVAGRRGALEVAGVDESYCEYRASAFIQGYDAMRALAGGLHG